MVNSWQNVKYFNRYFKLSSQELPIWYKKQAVRCREKAIFNSKIYNNMFVLFPMEHIEKAFFFQFSLNKNICIYILGKLDTC